MLKSNKWLWLVLTGLLLPAMAAQEPPAIQGYSADSARAEQNWEAKFKAIPDPANIRAYNQHLSARPHHVGSPYDKANAEWILAKFKSWGLDAHIETFNVLFPTPKIRVVEMVSPTKFVAKLEEPTVPGDSTSSQHAEQLPTYNAYSPDGDVTAPLVYVNYGTQEDYTQLKRLGISVKGAIVIARYGHSWRGIKPKLAHQHGAIGCLIYSDPADDGYRAGDTFPQGAWRPLEGVQRGSVMEMELYPGDPLTPGVGATAKAKRLPLSQAKTIEKIPVLPISYGDAKPLLSALAGPVAPAAWRGALGFTYHVGPGPAKVHLKLAFNWDIKPINDVIARIPGSTFPEEWVIRGNHHDAWVNGSADPVSGTSPLMEEARSFSELLKQGWKPKRTIILCAWDGEEPALIGSTEWVEEHADELAKHAAIYINSDSNGRGYLFAEGSHTLQKFIDGVAQGITDPEKNLPVEQRLRLREISMAKTTQDRQYLRSGKDLKIGALGSGSDYSPFIDHVGIASLNLGYGGEDGGGIYHSIYDDFYWYTHFGDPTFVYGRALAQTAGTAVMRFADADLLPYDFTGLASTVAEYAQQVEKLLKTMQAQTREQNQEIREGLFSATTDPQKPFVPPSIEAVPPHLNFAPLENALDDLKQSADAYQKVANKAEQNGGQALAHAQLQQVNEMLMQSERKLTTPGGLPGRPWYKHEIYAPGLYTGYGVKTLPGIREAIEQKQWQQANTQIGVVSKALEDESALIQSAASGLEKAIHPGI
ncbi:MAG TPA: M28 family metallopeptidase [Terriglobia bacterium]|nr:M28 family metallopeptidase [Terriglobia bacterium]